MENILTLTHEGTDGQALSATFLPEKGMNLASFKKGEVEVIDQATKHLLDERSAGLGALIGPHFHHRNPKIIPKIKDESLSAHIASLKAKGIAEPFSHGIARFAAWKAEKKDNTISAALSGKDLLHGISLAELEGQHFTMQFKAELQTAKLIINLSVVSETDSVVGLHHYYRLPKGQNIIKARVQPHYLYQGSKLNIPAEWDYNNAGNLKLPLNSAPYDYTFFHYPDLLQGEISLVTSEYTLHMRAFCPCEENSWQLYHPENASFVCIEPLSAKDPRHPNLTVSQLTVELAFS